MRLRILLALIAVGGLSIALFTVPLAIGVREFYRNETVLSLERQATEATGDVPRDYAARPPATTRSRSRHSKPPPRWVSTIRPADSSPASAPPLSTHS